MLTHILTRTHPTYLTCGGCQTMLSVAPDDPRHEVLVEVPAWVQCPAAVHRPAKALEAPMAEKPRLHKLTRIAPTIYECPDCAARVPCIDSDPHDNLVRTLEPWQACSGEFTLADDDEPAGDLSLLLDLLDGVRQQRDALRFRHAPVAGTCIECHAVVFPPTPCNAARAASRADPAHDPYSDEWLAAHVPDAEKPGTGTPLVILDPRLHALLNELDSLWSRYGADKVVTNIVTLWRELRKENRV